MAQQTGSLTVEMNAVVRCRWKPTRRTEKQTNIKIYLYIVVLIFNYLQLRIAKIDQFGSNLIASDSNKRLVGRVKVD